MIERRLGRKADARSALSQAAEVLGEVGAISWTATAHQELQKIGGRPPPSNSLSESEREVAYLVAAGKRNREIAGDLFVSVKTVESTLRSIFRKLGIRSRVELATLFVSGDHASGRENQS
jgi:DNA-binding NarL/FixJ family response regulator